MRGLLNAKSGAMFGLAVAMLVGCAATGSTDEASADSAAESPARTRQSDCFWSRSIYNFKALGRKSLIVWSPKNCAHLVEVGGGCSGLRSAISLGFSNNNGRICGYGGDDIVLDGGFPERCSILGVEKLTPERLLALVPDQPDDEDGTVSNCGKSLND